jgi:hypothetical protein
VYSFSLFSLERRRRRVRETAARVAIIIITRWLLLPSFDMIITTGATYIARAVRHKSPGPLKGGFLFISSTQQPAAAASGGGGGFLLFSSYSYFFPSFSSFHRKKKKRRRS